MSRFRIVCWTVIAALLWAFPPFGLSQQGSTEIDYERMRQDLEIMESILKKLLSTPDLERRGARARVSGIGVSNVHVWAGLGGGAGDISSAYLDEFGVIFDADYRGGGLHRDLERLERQLAASKKEMRALSAYSSSTKRRAEEDFGSVSGRIRDKEGRAVKGAYVIVGEREVQTDDRGEFSIKEVEPGSYTLLVVAPGFKEETREDFAVAADEAASVDLVLEVDETIENLKAQLIKFLANYADAIGQIAPSQSVMVILNFPRDGLALPVVVGETGFVSLQSGPEGAASLVRLEAQVKKQDIIEYRRGNLNLPEFRTRVKFREVSDSADDTDLDIFVEIVRTVFEKRAETSSFAADDIHGFYVDGHGAVVMMEARAGSRWVVIPDAQDVFLRRDLERRAEVVARSSGEERSEKSRAKEKETEENEERALEKFKEQLVDILGDFGHTLRRIPSTGSIAIVADIEPGRLFGNRRRVVCEVNKRDIDEYNRRSIDRQEFSNRVTWREF